MTGHGHGLPAGELDLLVFLAVGVLAGAHCLGMCGPLVTTYADRIGAAAESRRRDTLTPYVLRQHLLFNLGRTASYALVGAAFGLLGYAAFASVDTVLPVADGVRGVVGVLVGILIIGVAGYYLRGRPIHGIPMLDGVGVRLTGRLTAIVDRRATSPGIVGLGALHGTFPCPIIYPAYLYAFVQASPVRGAVGLGLIGLGTIPTLLAYGTFIGAVTVPTRVRLHRVLGLCFLLLGYVPLQHGLMLLGLDVLPHPPIPYYDPFT